MKVMLLPTDPQERKNIPITCGVLDYFPLAMAEVARVSKAGNDQHNPGQPMHWDKTKSLDHADCIARHLIDRGSRDSDGMRHSAKLAWRALALLETELEREAAEVAAGRQKQIKTLDDYIKQAQRQEGLGQPDGRLGDLVQRVDGEGSGHPD